MSGMPMRMNSRFATPLQGRVDLAHVERPHLPRARLELLPQLETVLRPLAEQGEQRVPDAHSPDTLRIMRSAYSVF